MWLGTGEMQRTWAIPFCEDNAPKEQNSLFCNFCALLHSLPSSLADNFFRLAFVLFSCLSVRNVFSSVKSPYFLYFWPILCQPQSSRFILPIISFRVSLGDLATCCSRVASVSQLHVSVSPFSPFLHIASVGPVCRYLSIGFFHTGCSLGCYC